MADRIFVNGDGSLIGVFKDGGAPGDKQAVEVFTLPSNGRDRWDFQAAVWTPVEPPYEEKRKQEYLEKLGDQGDQFDAIYKGVLAIVDLLKAQGVTDAALQDAGLLPDKTKSVDTPAGWLGTVKEIKDRNPKP